MALICKKTGYGHYYRRVAMAFAINSVHSPTDPDFYFSLHH